MNAIYEARTKLDAIRQAIEAGDPQAANLARLMDAWLSAFVIDTNDDAQAVSSARDMYCNDDLEIDDRACVSRADYGT